MLKEDFSIGPFTISPAGSRRVNGQAEQWFNIYYGTQLMHEKATAAAGTQAQVADQLDDTLGDIVIELRREHERNHRIDLVSDGGERLASFTADSYALADMTPGLIDDRAPYWLRSADRLYSQPVTLGEYARLRGQHERPRNAWMADLLDDELLTLDSEAWRAPTPWELRHLVGVGSLTGITGGKAAELVGVSPQNFRKYTAREGAKNRQNMSFSMWHLLLHRLEVQRLPEGWS